MSSAAIEVAIIDSGGANLASLQYALERLGARCADELAGPAEVPGVDDGPEEAAGVSRDREDARLAARRFACGHRAGARE